MRHLPALHDLPEPAGVRVRRHALEDDLRRTHHRRTVGDVRVPGDPPAVRGAEVDVAALGLHVEDVLEGGVGAHHVSAGGVQDALRRARGAGGVEDEERVLRRHPRRRALVLLLGHVIFPQDVTPEVVLDGHHLWPEALEHQHVAHEHGLLLRDLESLVGDVVQLDGLAAAHHTVAGDHDVRAGIHQAVGEGLRREAAEDDRVHRTDARARQHRQRQLADHRHEEGDAVAGLHA
mmetsp:Transcript_40474/g.104742  ORF Transcript_40474/g.104742 Transcript_40474/m.104742 type:complete len:234 (+) Transcript_40474:820-1521(+)